MELSDFEGLRYQRVQSTRNVPGTNLTGTWKFQLATSATTRIKSLRESMFVLKGKTDGPMVKPQVNDVNADYLANNIGFAQNPCGGLFSTVNCSINGQELGVINNWKSHTAIKKCLDSSIEEELASNNPMLLCPGTYAQNAANGTGKKVWISYNSDVAAQTIPVTTPGGVNSVVIPAITFSRITEKNYLTHKINSLIIHDVNELENPTAIPTASSFTLSFQFPFLDMLHDEDEFIGPNCMIAVTFQVSPTVTSDLFVGYNAVKTIEWSEFEWIVPIYTADPIINMTLNRRFYEIETQTFTIGSVKSFQVIAPSNLHRVAICIMRDSTLDYQSNVPTRDTTKALTSLFIQYGGRQYPEPSYRLTLTAADTDWYNAWQDYKTFAQANQSGELPVIRDFQTFIDHPVFVFQVRQSSGSVVSTPLNINFQHDDNYANHSLCVYMESVSELSMMYNENGSISETRYEKIG